MPANTYLVQADSDHYDKNEALMFATEAGQIASAMTDTHDTDIVVFEFEMSEETADDNLLPDTSCENADGCWCISNKTLNELIQAGVIKMRAKRLKDMYVPYLRAFYLANLSKTYLMINDELLQHACDLLQNIEWDRIYDDLLPYISCDRFDDATDMIA